MNFTRIFSFLLALITVLTLVACGNGNSEGKVPDTPSEDTNPGGSTGDNPSDDENQPGGELPTVEYTPVDQFLKNMAMSQFVNADEVDANIGLTDHKSVGVDADKYRNEELYGVPADSEFKHVYNVADYGITPNATDNASKLNALLSEIKDVEGLKKISFPEGVYLIDKTIVINGQKDLYICCEDTAKSFELRLSNWFQGFNISNCKNVHLNNFDFDYVDSPTVAGEILSVDAPNKKVVVKIFDEFDLTQPVYTTRTVRTYIEFKPDERGEWYPYNTVEGGSLISYDPETREMVLRVSPNAITTSSSLTRTEVGSRVSLSYTVYDYYGFNGGNNDGLYFENLNVYATAGMAFAFSRSNIYMNRVDLDLREGSTRLMTATADGLHCADCPIVKVTNSTSQYSHDDSFNIKGTYYDVLSCAGKVMTFRTTSLPVEVGDEINVYEPTRFGDMGTYKIVAVDPNNPGKVTLDKIAPDVKAGCLFANATKAPSFHIENCVLGNKRNRAMLVQCRNVIIKNVAFKNYYHGTINIHTVRDQFKEGICPRNVEVTGCKFLGGARGVSAGSFGTSGVATSGLFKGIKVNNNFFYGPSSGVSMGYLGDAEITNNLFYNVGVGCSTLDTACAIYIASSEDVTVSTNYSYHDTRDRKHKAFYSADVENLKKSKNVYVVLDELDK